MDAAAAAIEPSWIITIPRVVCRGGPGSFYEIPSRQDHRESLQ